MPRIPKKAGPIGTPSLRDKQSDLVLQLEKLLKDEHLRGETIIFMMEKQEKAMNSLAKAIIDANKTILKAIQADPALERTLSENIKAAGKEFATRPIQNGSHLLPLDKHPLG